MTTKQVKSTKPARNASPADAPERTATLSLEALDGVLVDLDGVVIETAKLHAEAWKTMFDEYLRYRAARLGGTFQPFDLTQDYKRYVDGKPRYDAVATFLGSRSIYLPLGDEGDPPQKETVCGLGNRKNQLYLAAARQRGIDVYQTSIDFLKRLRSQGLRVAAVTSRRDGRDVLKAAGIGDLFDAQVDGDVAREWLLAEKPAPDTYLEAARRLGVAPQRAAVIEDAIAGVQAGKAGDFALVVGVCRDGRPELLRQQGADIVVADLRELAVGPEEGVVNALVPSALDKLAEVRARIAGRRVVAFLDYDGTLTPIVERPELAVLSDDMKATLRALADRCTVVVISGRERGDVTRLVGLDNIIYAGCHGFDIAGPKGTRIAHAEGAKYLPVVAQAAAELARRLASIAGVIVEDKTYAVAVHFRMARDADVARAKRAVESVLARHTLLRRTSGKKVLELLPNIAWDKGEAVLWLLDALDLARTDVVPVYLGDDVTDRDAFLALHGRGITALVAARPRPTCADYRLRDTNEVGVFLRELTALLEQRGD